MSRTPLLAALLALALAAEPLSAQASRDTSRAAAFRVAARRDDARVARLKSDAVRSVDSMSTLTQQIVDMLFSFGELGFQEVESARYLGALLESHGFAVQRGYAGMPTAWVARWGSGKPVIAIGSDVDGIPQASQKPGVAYRAPLVEGAPGHGEGHNAGQAVNITAAIALKRIMERDKLPGTIVLWPGVAEELVGAKAYFVREGLFRDADAALFTHVSSNLTTAWGGAEYNALISAEYAFRGQAAHAAGRPWRGRSALDAAILMETGWNFRREHLPPEHRSHSVIRDGGDQPNVVPQTSTIWYYFRDINAARTREQFAVADSVARGAALMTGTQLERVRVLGSAWAPHYNKPIAYALDANIQRVGMPRWDEKDQTLARAVQREVGSTARGLDMALAPMAAHFPDEAKRGGGSDDIGDVTWALPTATLFFPSNIPELPGHHWANAISMATPLAHKGATSGAKALAMTLVDLFTKPELLRESWDYFRTVQGGQYAPFIRPEDRPAIEMNTGIMARYKPELQKFYYDPAKYRTYLEQLGITYPTVRP